MRDKSTGLSLKKQETQTEALHENKRSCYFDVHVQVYKDQLANRRVSFITPAVFEFITISRGNEPKELRLFLESGNTPWSREMNPYFCFQQDQQRVTTHLLSCRHKYITQVSIPLQWLPYVHIIDDTSYVWLLRHQMTVSLTYSPKLTRTVDSLQKVPGSLFVHTLKGKSLPL